MIIDLILDRKEWEEYLPNYYEPNQFYRNCMEYNSVFTGIADGILSAMDYGEEDDVRRELCNYVAENGYSLDICNYINSRNWIE